MYITVRPDNIPDIIEVESNVPITAPTYPMNDLNGVYTHYNPETGLNEPTPNTLSKGGNS